MNFLNSNLSESTIQINIDYNELNQEQINEINYEINNFLQKKKLLEKINSENGSIVMDSEIDKDAQKILSVSYRNKIKQAKDQDTYLMVGEIIERALNVQE